MASAFLSYLLASALFQTGNVSSYLSIGQDKPDQAEPSSAVEQQEAEQQAAEPLVEEDQIVFYGPDGEPLPAEIQAELRAQIALQKEANGESDDSRGDGYNSIVISGIRKRGAVRGNALPEIVFNYGDLQAYGASNVGELLDRLAPRSTGSIGSGSTAILINGKRAINLADLSSYPADAIERVEVLPEATAVAYGFPGNQKLINVITFERYRSIALESELDLATRGGGTSFDVGSQLFRIDDELRINLPIQYRRREALTYADRGYRTFGGREIFPASESIAITPSIAGVAGAIGYGGSLSYRSDISNQEVGLIDALSQLLRSSNETLSAGLKINRDLGRLSSSLFGNLSEQNSRLDLGAGSSVGEEQRSEFILSSINSEAILSGAVASLGGEQIFGTGSIFLEREDASVSRQSTQTEFGRTVFRALVSADVPLAGVAGQCDGPIGCLTSQISLRPEFTTGTDTFIGYRFGLNWIPSPSLNLNFSVTRNRLLPTLEEITGHGLDVPGAFIFDALTDRIGPVELLLESNPGLQPSRVDQAQAQFVFRPIRNIDLVFSGTLVHSETRDPILTLASGSTLFQQSFPDRYQRNLAGELVSVDASPINGVKSDRNVLQLTASFSRALGQAAGREKETIVRSIPEDGDIASALPPGAVIIMAEEGTALADFVDAGQSRISISAKYRRIFSDNVELIDGVFADLRETGPINGTFGQPTDLIDFQFGIFSSGLGGTIDMSYLSSRAAGISSSEESGGIERNAIDDTFQVDLSVFVNLEEVWSAPLARGARVRVSATNIFDQVEGLNLDDASRMAGLFPNFADPTGRVVSISVRKTF